MIQLPINSRSEWIHIILNQLFIQCEFAGRLTFITDDSVISFPYHSDWFHNIMRQFLYLFNQQTHSEDFCSKFKFRSNDFALISDDSYILPNEFVVNPQSLQMIYIIVNSVRLIALLIYPYSWTKIRSSLFLVQKINYLKAKINFKSNLCTKHGQYSFGFQTVRLS